MSTCKRCDDTGWFHFSDEMGRPFLIYCDCPKGLRQKQVNEAAAAKAKAKAEAPIKSHQKRQGRLVVQRDIAADQGKLFGAGKD